jgi:hypothetical protein
MQPISHDNHTTLALRLKFKTALRRLTGIRDSAVDVTTGYGPEDRVVAVRIPLGVTFSLLHVGPALPRFIKIG